MGLSRCCQFAGSVAIDTASKARQDLVRCCCGRGSLACFLELRFVINEEIPCRVWICPRLTDAYNQLYALVPCATEFAAGASGLVAQLASSMLEWHASEDVCQTYMKFVSKLLPLCAEIRFGRMKPISEALDKDMSTCEFDWDLQAYSSCSWACRTCKRCRYEEGSCGSRHP